MNKIVQPQIDFFKSLFSKLGYKFFERGSYNLNIICIRKLISNNKFNDTMFLVFKDFKAEWIIYQFNITTIPGKYYLENPMTSKGTAIIVPGQYSKAYKFGKHKDYPALQQVGPVKVYRDNDKDDVHDLEPSTIQEGVFHVNIHHATANGTSTNVDKWSAGCIVFSNILEWNLFLSTIHQGRQMYGDFFTLTLIDETQI